MSRLFKKLVGIEHKGKEHKHTDKYAALPHHGDRRPPSHDNHHVDPKHNSHKYDFDVPLTQQIMAVQVELNSEKLHLNELSAKYESIPFFRVFKKAAIESAIVAASVEYHEYIDELDWLIRECQLTHIQTTYGSIGQQTNANTGQKPTPNQQVVRRPSIKRLTDEGVRKTTDGFNHVTVAVELDIISNHHVEENIQICTTNTKLNEIVYSFIKTMADEYGIVSCELDESQLNLDVICQWNAL